MKEDDEHCKCCGGDGEQFEGIKHHALDDAKHEAKMLQKHLCVDVTHWQSLAPEFMRAPEQRITADPRVTCGRCKGTGESSRYDAITCSDCNGTGLAA